MLYLIAGHGDGDPGATGGEYTEAELNRKICAAIKKLGGNNVIYLDPTIDHFKAHTLGSMTIPKDGLVIEIHMDAFGNPAAKGGHVIINAKFEPDEYDKALAQFCADYIPGRAQPLVKRNDLYNCNVCAQRGINYRLLECGFITNAEDNARVRTKTDEIAERILNCFKIPIQQETKPAPKIDGTAYTKTITFKLIVSDSGEIAVDKVEVE